MMIRRIAGLILLILLTPAAIIAWIHLTLRVIIWPDNKAAEILTGLDLFGNAGMFNGSRWETISSHAGRELGKGTRWAIILSAFLDVLEKDHCIGANANEQPLLDEIHRFQTRGAYTTKSKI